MKRDSKHGTTEMTFRVHEQPDLLGESLRNLHLRFHLHNDLFRRWLGSLQVVPQIAKSSSQQNREQLLVG